MGREYAGPFQYKAIGAHQINTVVLQDRFRKTRSTKKRAYVWANFKMRLANTRANGHLYALGNSAKLLHAVYDFCRNTRKRASPASVRSGNYGRLRLVEQKRITIGCAHRESPAGLVAG